MTVATYTTNLSRIWGDGSTSGWTALGSGASGLNQESDFYIQGNNCISKNAFASATKGMIYSYGSDAGGSGTDGAYIAWLTHLTPNSLANKAGGGLQFLIGSGTGDYEQYYVGGSDTIEFGGWVLAAVNEATAGDTSTGSPSTTVESYFGALYSLPSGGPTKGAPNAIDGIAFGRCDVVIEYGTGADPEADFAGIITNLETPTNRWGLFAQREPNGAYENSGLIQFGTSTNAAEFTDSNQTIFLRDHDHVTSNFHTWEVNHASTILTLTNVVVKALGSTSPGRWVTNDNATVTLTTCNFIDMGTFLFDTNSTIDTCTFLGCGQITHGGSDMSGSSVLQSSVAADTGALLYDETGDPDTLTDGMTFSMGTNSHHAIDFGTSVTNDIVLRDCKFNGFGSTDNANDSTVRFLATGGALTLSLNNCKVDGAAASLSNFSVDDAAGINVTLSIDSVTTLVNVKDNNGDNLLGARALLEASDGTGDFPFEESVTITRSGSTASVAHTGHGMLENDYVVIRGADQPEYNGPHQISNVTTNAYDYTVSGAPATPATGTIISTGAILSGTTDSSGNISKPRTFTNNTPVTGVVRKSSSTPRFKSFLLSGTIDSSVGLTINVRLVLDE